MSLSDVLGLKDAQTFWLLLLILLGLLGAVGVVFGIYLYRHVQYSKGRKLH